MVVEFSNIIKTENQPAILAAIKNVKPDVWQMLVDDLIGYCSKQATSHNPVKNPAGVMRKMVQRVQLGEYVADLAHLGQQLRANDRRRNLRVIPTVKPPAKPPTEKQLSAFRATFRKVKT